MPLYPQLYVVSGRPESSAGPGPEGRTPRERARAHAEARAERWRNGAEKVAAAWAAAVVGNRAGGVGAEPVASGFAQRINALHGEARQILHARSLSDQPALPVRAGTCRQKFPWAARMKLNGANCAASCLWCQAKRPLVIVVGLRELRQRESLRPSCLPVSRIFLECPAV